MSRRFLLAWLFLVTAVSSTRAQVPLDQSLVPSRTALARIGLERQWMQIVGLHGNERLIEISIADNLLFTQTNRANFSAYNAETGQHLWSLSLGAKTGDAQPASANSFAVFVTNSNELYAIDRRTGRPLWVQLLEALPTGPTACDEGRVMVGLNSGKLMAYALKVKKEKGPERISGRALRLWNWQTNAPVVSRAQPSGPLIAFGSLDGKVYVSLAETATMVWRFATGGEIAAPLATHDTRTLLVPSADMNVYAVDLWTAETKWIFSSGAPVRQEPMVSDDDAYVANTAGALSAVDVKTGLARWTIPTHGGRLISISDKRLYLESHDGDLFIVDRSTGQVIADPRATLGRAGVNLRGYSLGITNHLNDRLFFATPSGMVICLRESGQVNPRPLRPANSKPFGYVPPEGIKLPREAMMPGESKPVRQEDVLPGNEGAAPKAGAKDAAAPEEKSDAGAPEEKEKEKEDGNAKPQ